MAEKASITPQYLSRIENGGYSKNVSLSTLMKIAGVLDCSAMIWYQEFILGCVRKYTHYGTYKNHGQTRSEMLVLAYENVQLFFKNF